MDRARNVGPDETDAQALLKALARRRLVREGPVTLTTKDGTLVGSAAAKTTDGGIILLGWFELTADAFKALPLHVQSTIREMAKHNDQLGILRTLQEAKVELDPLNGLLAKTGDALADVDGAPASRRFAAGDVVSLVRGKVAGVPADSPIRTNLA
jgi:hypothetical protein